MSYSTAAPVPTSRADLVENWKSGLQRAEASQHVLSGMLIDFDGEHASVALNQTAWLYDPQAFGSHVFCFGTIMTVGLRCGAQGWRVTSLTVRPRWGEGNAAVLGDGRPPHPSRAPDQPSQTSGPSWRPSAGPVFATCYSASSSKRKRIRSSTRRFAIAT